MTRKVGMGMLAGVICLAVSATVLAAETRTPFNGNNLVGWNVCTSSFSADDRIFWMTAKDVRLDPNDERCLELIPFAPDEPRTDGVIVNNRQDNRGVPRGLNLVTNERFGSAIIEMEVMVPKGSNSGIYILGEYEVQVLDSFGKPDDKLTQGDFGAVYSASAPKINASTAPGTWQTVLIDYDVAQWDSSGNKIAKMKVNKVEINGKLVQENVEVNGPTGGGMTYEKKIETAYGPLMFQGDHGPVAYRRIKITEKNPKNTESMHKTLSGII